jgi:hypothetical protein
LIAAPLLFVLLLAAGWSGFWLYAANKAEATLTQWREREAQAGRIYSCGKQAVGGYPFRIELTCSDTTAEITRVTPRLSVRGNGLHVASQVYDPTLLIAELGAPITVAVAGAPPFRASWMLAQMSARGTPATPQRVSVVLEEPRLNRQIDGVDTRLGHAQHVEAHARVAAYTACGRPFVDLAVDLAGVEAPALHPVAAQPFDFTAVAVLNGLDNLRPLPVPERLRQLQAAGGRLEVTRARLHQGEVTAVAVGSLGLTAAGRLDGELTMSVAGLDRVLPLLGIDQLPPDLVGNGKVTAALNSLDGIFLGLSRAARSHAGAGLAAGLAFLGQPTQLEGQKAIALPLRFADGVVYLGPLRVGTVPPLY